MSTTQPAAAIAALLENHGVDLSWQRDFYLTSHQDPELSLHEERTAARIARVLSRFDCEVITGIGGHGLVGIFRNGSGPCVLMRADIDALPVQETSGADYASQNEGVMHACGHDMHFSSLLGACAILDAHKDAWQGTFVALFQPAEEVTMGALNMVSAGLADKIPAPDVCFGQHIWAGPAGQVQSKPHAALAACDSIEITITGKSSHASSPYLAIDPTFVAAMIVVRLQGIVAREVSPFDFAVVSVGTLEAGNTNNTIPATARLVLNCRFYSEAVRDATYAAIERVVKAECVASNCPEPPVFRYFAHGELTDNDPAVFERVRPVFDAVFGEDSVDQTPWTASEDFATIPNAFNAPYLFWMVGITPREQWEQAQKTGQPVPTNHMGSFLPDLEPTLRACTLAGAAAVLTYLSSAS